MDSYSVILKNSDEERLKIKAFLKNHYSFNEEETLAFLKKSPGFLIENRTLEKAQEVHKKAHEHNVQTLIIDDKDIPQLPKPMSFMEIEIKDSGFFFITKSIKEYVPFENVTMTATGITNEDSPETSIENLSLELHKKTEKLLNLGKTEITSDSKTSLDKTKDKELIFYMDIFLNKSPHRLRIKHNNFDYSFLGKEKLYSSIENFKLLLDKIITESMKSFKNQTTDAILKKEPLTHLIYDDIESYEKEIVWLNIVRH